MIGGIPLATIYWYTLIVCGVIAVLLVIFGDIFDFDGPIDPMLLVPWFAFTGLFGYIGEEVWPGNSGGILAVSAVVSTLLVFLLNFYILLPMKRSESTISISEKDMEGRVANVVTPIPISGMGEIQFKSVTGSLSRPAVFYTPQEEELPRGSEVLIIEVRERVCYVVPYTGSLQI